jgi:hypothetical protein
LEEIQKDEGKASPANGGDEDWMIMGRDYGKGAAQ